MLAHSSRSGLPDAKRKDSTNLFVWHLYFTASDVATIRPYAHLQHTLSRPLLVKNWKVKATLVCQFFPPRNPPPQHQSESSGGWLSSCLRASRCAQKKVVWEIIADNAIMIWVEWRRRKMHAPTERVLSLYRWRNCGNDRCRRKRRRRRTKQTKYRCMHPDKGWHS